MIYHFGARDRLLLEVLRSARRRQLAVFGRVLAPRDEPYARTLGRAWHVLTGPEGAPFLRLFGQVHRAPTDESLWPEFLRVATTDWLAPLEEGLREHGAAAAQHGPPSPPATFGAGPHRCPGAAHAVALATGVLTALRADGWRPVPGQPVNYEPRPNLRLPSTVLVDRT